MSRALTVALTADFSGFTEELFKYSDTIHLMLLHMTRSPLLPTQNWKRIGDIARILAGKLMVARELEKMAAAPAPVGKVERDGRVDPTREDAGHLGAGVVNEVAATAGETGEETAAAYARKGARTYGFRIVSAVAHPLGNATLPPRLPSGFHCVDLGGTSAPVAMADFAHRSHFSFQTSGR